MFAVVHSVLAYFHGVHEDGGIEPGALPALVLNPAGQGTFFSCPHTLDGGVGLS